MVDKRSLRSSKKDSQDAGAEEDEKSKQPSRQRSTRSRKTKTQPETPSNESPGPLSNPSDEIVVEAQPVLPAPDHSNEDVEMKTAEEGSKEEKPEESVEPVEDPKAAVITSILFHVWT
jgi:hypothetical protein